jgi:16S rRNA (uracil1498-N3)-methyltransferase
MPTAERFFSESPIRGKTALLDGPEAHHLIHVMRAKVGTRITLFDGYGLEHAAEVERLGRSEATLAILASASVDRELPFELTLAVALPKGDRQKWLVEKATELGVTRLVPLQTARGVAQPVQQALARLRRTVIEASKQCGRNRLMDIAEPADWAAFIERSRAVALRLLAHPAAQCPESKPACLREALVGRRALEPVSAAIGPEGGFAEPEVAAATAAGWLPVDLGPRILRVETAALHLAAIVAGCG